MSTALFRDPALSNVPANGAQMHKCVGMRARVGWEHVPSPYGGLATIDSRAEPYFFSRVGPIPATPSS